MNINGGRSISDIKKVQQDNSGSGNGSISNNKDLQEDDTSTMTKIAVAFILAITCAAAGDVETPGVVNSNSTSAVEFIEVQLIEVLAVCDHRV